MSQKKNKGRTKAGRPAGGARRQRAGMSKGVTWAVLLLFGAGFAAFVTEPLWNNAQPIPVGDAAQVALGAEMFTANCQACHGAGAVGQIPSQRMGGEDDNGVYIAPALNGTAHAWHHPEDALFRTIKKGSIAQQSPMKGFEGRLSDGEIRAVLAYIQSLWPADLLARYRRM